MIRVFLVDDHDLFRAGVASELGGDIDLIGEASDVADAIEGISDAVPEVVLLDVHMAGGGGKAVIEAIAPMHPNVAFLALSASNAAEDVVGLIRAGARGYVTKSISSEELAEAIQRVARGDAVFSPRLAGFVLDTFSEIDVANIDPQLDLLTGREREVLRYIARGYTYREIADELDISAKTVESHVSAVLRKLQMSSRHELSAWAIERKLT